MSATPEFRTGSLDHVHIQVPELATALAWYSTHLGFEPVQEYDFWGRKWPAERYPTYLDASGAS